MVDTLLSGRVAGLVDGARRLILHPVTQRASLAVA
jgi:hypothetical protein